MGREDNNRAASREQLVEFLGTYLMVEREGSDGTPPNESSTLILPSTKLTS
jgi:hypothetical protein